MRRFNRVLMLGLGSLAYSQSIPSGPVDVRLQVDYDLNDVRAKADEPAMRAFAWRAFHTITRPVPDDERFPIWMSWCTRKDVLSCGCPERGGGSVRSLSFNDQAKPGRVLSKGVDVLSSLFYSPSVVHYLNTQKIYDAPLVSGYRKQLMQKAKCFDTKGVGPGDRDIPPLARSSIVVKPAWIIVKHPKPGSIAKIPVWDGQDDPHNKSILEQSHFINMADFSRTVTLNFRGLSPRRDCKTQPLYPQEEPDGTISLVDHFFFYQVCAVDTLPAEMLKICASGVCPLSDGDILVLAGLHVITRQIDDWTWSTFWWHDRPTRGPFAKGRPPELNADSIWRHYLMDVTFDEDTPREADGSSRAIFNPYLEAQIPDGYRSNCMSCHRLAAVHCSYRGKCDEQAASERYQGLYDVHIPGRDVGFPVPIHGTDRTNALFDGAVRTGFLWSIADRGGNLGCQTP